MSNFGPIHRDTRLLPLGGRATATAASGALCRGTGRRIGLDGPYQRVARLGFAAVRSGDSDRAADVRNCVEDVCQPLARAGDVQPPDFLLVCFAYPELATGSAWGLTSPRCRRSSARASIMWITVRASADEVDGSSERSRTEGGPFRSGLSRRLRNATRV